MKKITLTKDFLEQLLTLDSHQCASVLLACKQLLEVDDDTLESMQLASGTSSLVTEVHADMKRRVRAARRRRQRREEKAAREAAEAELQAKSQPESVEAATPAVTEAADRTAEPRQSPYTVTDYHRVVEALLSGAPILTGSQYVLLIKLARLILKRLNPHAPSSHPQTSRHPSHATVNRSEDTPVGAIC